MMHFIRRGCARKTPVITHYPDRETLSHTEGVTFKRMGSIGLKPLPLILYPANGKPTVINTCISADECSYEMSFYVQSIVTLLQCSCCICVTRQRQFESLSLQRCNHHNSKSTPDNSMKPMISA